jgi:hypothetical protein
LFPHVTVMTMGGLWRGISQTSNSKFFAQLIDFFDAHIRGVVRLDGARLGLALAPG